MFFSTFLSSSSFQLQQSAIRHFSKYMSKAATKRQPLSPKRAHKGYYKGNRSTKEGHITSKGRFVVDRLKQLELVVPDMVGFRLKPYIASTVPKVPPEIRRDPVAGAAAASPPPSN